jgi:hypothetical protein
MEREEEVAECCENCRFGDGSTMGYIMYGSSKMIEERVILCRRMPPVATGERGMYTPIYGEYPRVAAGDWCGEWKEKVDKAVPPA